MTATQSGLAGSSNLTPTVRAETSSPERERTARNTLSINATGDPFAEVFARIAASTPPPPLEPVDAPTEDDSSIDEAPREQSDVEDTLADDVPTAFEEIPTAAVTLVEQPNGTTETQPELQTSDVPENPKLVSEQPEQPTQTRQQDREPESASSITLPGDETETIADETLVTDASTATTVEVADVTTNPVRETLTKKPANESASQRPAVEPSTAVENEVEPLLPRATPIEADAEPETVSLDDTDVDTAKQPATTSTSDEGPDRRRYTGGQATKRYDRVSNNNDQNAAKQQDATPPDVIDTTKAETVSKPTAIQTASSSATLNPTITSPTAPQASISVKLPPPKTSSNNAPTHPVASSEKQPRAPGSGHQAASNGSGKATRSETLTAVQRAKLVQRVSRSFQHLGRDGGQVRLRLSPEQLGSLQLDVQIQDGVMRGRMIAQSEMAGQVLRENMSELRASLETQGIRLERIDVEVDLRGQSDTSSQWQGDPRSQQDQRQARHQLTLNQPESTRPTSLESPAAVGIRNANTNLDLHV
ncbi:MAG: flagellar hook-length control protein FliK [Planctomycetota bacterium]